MSAGLGWAHPWVLMGVEVRDDIGCSWVWRLEVDRERVVFSCSTSFTQAAFLDGARILAEPTVHCVGLSCQPACLGEPQCLPPGCWHYRSPTHPSAIYVGAGDLISGPHTCMTSAL